MQDVFIKESDGRTRQSAQLSLVVMVGAIKLRGCTPYKLEYSRSFLKKNSGKYESPYGAIYSYPFESALTPNISNHYTDKSYKVFRILNQYHFYTNYKKKSLAQINLNIIF